MTYSKPTVALLGNASRVIESVDPKPDIQSDDLGSNRNPSAAYDLDE